MISYVYYIGQCFELRFYEKNSYKKCNSCICLIRVSETGIILLNALGTSDLSILYSSQMFLVYLKV